MVLKPKGEYIVVIAGVERKVRAGRAEAGAADAEDAEANGGDDY